MKYKIVVGLFLLPFLVVSKVKCETNVEIFVTTRDCMRFISKLDEVISILQKQQELNYKIISDSKALKFKLLNEIESLEQEKIHIDSEIIYIICQDGRSRVRIQDDDGSYEMITLSDFKKSFLLKHNNSQDRDTMIIYKDDLFSGINVLMSDYEGKIGVLNKVLNYFLIAENIAFDPVVYRYDYSISSEDYKKYLKTLEPIFNANKLFDYKDIIEINRQKKLPLFSVSSFDLRGNKISLYETVYIWYEDEISGDSINHAFNFHTTVTFDNATGKLKDKKIELLDPFEFEGELYIMNIYSQSLKINDSVYYRYALSVTDPNLNKKIENRLLGLTYNILDDKLNILSLIKVDSFIYFIDTESIQNVVKYVYSNTNIINKYLDNYVITNKTLNTVIDLKNGNIKYLNDFLAPLKYSISNEINQIRYWYSDVYDYSILYSDHEKRHFLIINNDQKNSVSKRRIRNYGRQIGVVHQQQFLFALNLSVDEDCIEIHRYNLNR